MRNLFYFLALSAIFAAVWGTIAAVLITRFLDQRGIKTPFILFRIYVFRNIGRYRKITMEENGGPGELYYHCVGAFIAALILGLAALAVRFLAGLPARPF